jgi:phospholipase C
MTIKNKPKHVFVVMLENRSFDNLLGDSGFQDNIDNNYNTYKNTKYKVSSPAPTTMTTDPGHELHDVLQQLTNIPFSDWTSPLGKYPRQKFPKDFENGTGFASSYATANDEDNSNPEFPSEQHIGDIMLSFAPKQLPVLNTLANEFAVCTNWFSAIPGPTWPNRFFLHFASSNGMDCSPKTKQIAGWINPLKGASHGFPSPKNGSIFKALKKAGCNYRVYNDCHHSYDPLSKNFLGSDFSDDPEKGGHIFGLGWIPQVASLTDIKFDSWYGLKHYFPLHLTKDYDCQYTFIEPNYGNLRADTYQGGSSQHPMDDVYGGENLVKFVYETLRNSPIWNDSLLIITYDEHGGFYDSVQPPPAVKPNDGSKVYGQKHTLNHFGFEFDQQGVRVPAIIISPHIQKGSIDKIEHDHTSVIATIRSLFSTDENPIPYLTDRDKAANDVLNLLTLETPRTDCPTHLPEPVKSTSKSAVQLSKEQMKKIDSQLLPESGNLIGALGILMKLDLEMSEQEPSRLASIKSNLASMKTRGDLRDYSLKVANKLLKMRQKNKDQA